jgi:N-acetylglucosaminyldiphosphoundecaprenol N-acetyl-beta-D-mannosaminyltransferase
VISHGKRNILGILVDALDYEAAVKRIVQAANEHRRFAMSTASVHVVMEGVLNQEQRFRLNHLDLLTPDGQPVRWALNILHGVGLADRVCGPKLMPRLCEKAEKENLAVYFYGNTPDVLSALRASLERRFPRLRIAGMEPSKFRKLSRDERDRVARRIRESGASLVFVGLGCPRQDVWAYEYRQPLSLPIVAVGGAFGVMAGKVRGAPEWMQERGLEWLFRLYSEPRRLWRRYLLLNPIYTLLIALQATGLVRFGVTGQRPANELLYG